MAWSVGASPSALIKEMSVLEGKKEKSSALPAARWCYWAIMSITAHKARMDQIPVLQS